MDIYIFVLLLFNAVGIACIADHLGVKLPWENRKKEEDSK